MTIGKYQAVKDLGNRQAWHNIDKINAPLEKRETFCRLNTRPCCSGLIWVLLTVVLLLPSCGGKARTIHFKNFSEAAHVYTEAVDVLLDEAGASAVDTDSMILIKTREKLDSGDRRNTIIEHNKLLRERLEILGFLKRHAHLLRTYFEALGALAGSDVESKSGTAAEGVVEALGELHPKIEEAKIGELEVSSFVGEVTNIVVGHFKLAALESELNKRAKTIERELDLQQAALNTIAEVLRTDISAQIQQQELNEVVQPYVKEGLLPSDWSKKRREALTLYVSLASVEAAADAAEKLKITFIALAEGRFQLVDVPNFIDDINQILTLFEKIKGENETEEE